MVRPLLLLPVVVVPLTCTAAQQEAASLPAAKELLERMRQAYSTCSTYRDTGVMTITRAVRREGERSLSTRFATRSAGPADSGSNAPRNATIELP